MSLILIIAVCLFINALFSCFEMAFVSASRVELKKSAKHGNLAAGRVLSLRENPERTLSTIQIGITLVGMISAAVGGAGAEESIAPIFEKAFQISEQTSEAIAIVLVVLPLTLLSVVFGELVPKTIALRDPVRISVYGARWIALFEKGVSPIVTMLEWATRIVMLPFPKKKISVEAESQALEIGDLSQQTRQYVLNLVVVESLRTRDAMVKWDQVMAISKNLSLGDVTAAVIRSGHTRLPVYEDGHVAGVLHTKEFIALVAAGNTQDWQSLIRPAIQVSENDMALKALRLMQAQRSHLSIVVSQADQRALGILTMEDVFEKIVGEIFDEDDDGRIRKLLSGEALKRRILRK